MVAQQIIDYAVRNLTTGDGEQERVIEYPYEIIKAFCEVSAKLHADVSPTLVTELARLLTEPGDWYSSSFNFNVWRANEGKVLAILTPFVSNEDLYWFNYGTWERRVLAA